MAATHQLSYEVMDAYHVNILRPDLHTPPKDGLHRVSKKTEKEDELHVTSCKS